MDVENIGSASGTGGMSKDDDRSSFGPGHEDLGNQTTNASNALPALVQREQNLSSDCDAKGNEIVTNGEKADHEVAMESKPERDKDGQTCESAASKEQQASRLTPSPTETGLEKPDSESGDQKTNSDGKSAASVKETDIYMDDECLTSAAPQEDEWMDILGNGQLKKKVNSSSRTHERIV